MGDAAVSRLEAAGGCADGHLGRGGSAVWARLGDRGLRG